MSWGAKPVSYPRPKSASITKKLWLRICGAGLRRVKALEEIDIKAVLKTLRKLLPKGARVLEVGTATAFVAVRLARLLPDGVVYTADPHPDWVDYLRYATPRVGSLPHSPWRSLALTARRLLDAENRSLRSSRTPQSPHRHPHGLAYRSKGIECTLPRANSWKQCSF